MCYIITHTLEFNNWRAFRQMLEFAYKYYGASTPVIEIEVPERIRVSGWGALDTAVNLLVSSEPKDPEEMSIYGKIIFDVQKSYTTTPEERGVRKIPINEAVEKVVGIPL